MRKRPQQQRSRQMVDTLVEATARCIAEHGLDGTTTPKIADLAGVSVGSLYQYFDGKDALISALIEKMAQDVAHALKHLPSSQTHDLEEMVSMAIRLGFALLDSDNKLYLELASNWQRLPTQRVADVLQQHIFELARMYFLKNYQHYPIENLQVKVFIIANSTIFTMVRFISENHAMLPEDDVAEGLIQMITGYLRQSMRQPEPPQMDVPQV